MCGPALPQPGCPLGFSALPPGQRVLSVRAKQPASYRTPAAMKQALPPPLPLGWATAPSANSSTASRIPELTELALETLARHPDRIYDLRGTAEHLACDLLIKIMKRGLLTHRLAIIFRDSGHDSIREAMSQLDILAGIPTHNTVPSPRSG